jgi:uncharacterized protein
MPRDYQTAAPNEFQRLPEYTRNNDWIKSFLHRSILGQVAHLSNGQPFITPTNFWYDEEHNAIAFHSNITGRMRSNVENNPHVCFVTSEFGRFLPSNAALEVSVQYRSVMVFGTIKLVEKDDDKRRVLTGMLNKYFPKMRPGVEYRPITDKELARTSVYSIKIESWSGKENWNEMAEQTDEWPALPPEILNLR